MISLTQATLLSVLFGSALGAFYTDPSQLTKKTYDFIVVGGGTAGNVVAARLSENPSVSVLVVEAGVSNTGYRSELVTIPFLGPQASVNSPFDWNYTTVPQAALNNQVLPYYRGYVLGGSSSTNFLTWTRGAKDDWDKYATLIGDSSYSWNNMLKYFKKSETWQHPVDGHSTAGQYNPAVHGTNGPIGVGVTPQLFPIDSRVIKTTQQLSSEFPFNLDQNSGKLLGVGWLQSDVKDGARSSSATGYLTPAVNSRKNIDVLIQTRVTKLVRTGTSGGLPEYKSLQIAQTPTSNPITLTAKKEIILSAGSINSPQILMLSGIGDPSTLKKAGVNATVSVPDLGKNLQDHPLIFAQWHVPDNASTFDPISLNEDPNALTNALAQWTANRTGVLSSIGSNHIGFFRLPDNSPVIKKYGDKSAGPGSAHYELAWQNGFVSVGQPFPTSGKYISNIHVLNAPTSRGYIAINSADPFKAPTIDPNFFSTDFDLQTMIYAVRSAQRFIRAQAWSGYALSAYSDSAAMFAPNSTDADVIAYIRKWTQSIKHPMCTAAANKDSSKGVVDANLKVRKISGVRIVDASVFPFIPSSHPVAGIYGLAELASDKIKSAYGL
ncbi:aryl-alcohol oxidase-like protein [Crucibulum laeve]|uniref:pyranose dehydrogenase (acceptor) n=1 Tax=Crucibulum laeve TaxID=68775 RepID=A0A5C3M9A8_9AGAR|nr:aryl-alcohol oxidase-like protein [Crucibulum laeve]